MRGVAGAETTAQGACSSCGGRGWIAPAAVVLLALIGGTPGEADAQSAAPSVRQIAFFGLAGGDSTYYRGDVVRVRVGFTQAVTADTTGGKPYVALTVGTVTRRAEFAASQPNRRMWFEYTVQAGDFDSDGVSVPMNGLNLNGATITARDDTTALASVTHDSAVGGPSRKVDGSKYRPPRVSSVTFNNSPASGDTYGYGENIEARVDFDHRVSVTTTGGTPSLALTIGAHTRQATLISPGRRTRLTFSYTVQAGDLAPAGTSIAANPVRLNGGTITHDADTATHALLAHGAVAADSTRKVNGRQGRPPKVEGVTFAVAAPKDSVYWRGDTIAVRVGFDDSVAVNTAGGKPQVALTVGTATRQATFWAHAGKALEFVYVVQAGDRDADGVSIPANALALNGATIRGTGVASTRDADLTHPLVAASAERTVDGSKVRAPAVRSVAFAGSVPDGGTYHYDTEMRVEVGFNRGVVVDTASGKPRLALSIGTQRRHAAFVPSASTGTTLVFAYRVQSADVDTDGASVGANALEPNGGTIKAGADSAVSANLTHDALASDLTRKVDGRPRITSLELYRREGAPPPPRGVHGYQERLAVLARFDQRLVLRQRVLLSIEVGADTVQLRSRANLREKGSAVAFFYNVTRDAVDTDGVRIPKGALTLSGGWLRAASDSVTNARLEHDGLAADSSWRVNGRLTPVPRPWVRVHDLPAYGSTYTRHERIRLGVSYSVGVVVTGTPELTLNLGTGTRRLTAVRSTLHQLFFEYVVQAGDVDEDGISVSANALSLPSGATIRSAADTSVVAALTHDSVPASAVHKVDGSRVTAAKVRWVSINPPPSRDSTYTRGELFHVNVIFDRAVAVDTTGGRPRVALQIGDSTRYAIYSHAHNFGPANHVFNFEVQAGDVDTDGLSIPANALELNGGTITAPDDTVRADVSHDAVTLGSAYKVNGDRSDAPHARWTWFHAPASGDTFLRDDQVVLTVTFDRPTAVDTVGGRPRVALQVGDSTRHATYLGHPRTTMRFEFGYVVQAGDVDTDGLSIPANALELNGGSFTLPGTTTPAVLTLDSLPTSAAHKVDGSRAGPASVARVSIHPPPSRDSTYTRSETFDVTAVFDRGVAVDTTGGRPRIALQIGDSTRYAIYSHAHSNGPIFQVFKFVVQAGDVDTDGLSIPANALELNGGTITAPDDTVRADVSHDAVTLGSAYKVNGDRSDAPHARWTWFHAPASGDTFLRDDQVVLTVTFDRPTAVDTVGGRPRVALQVGDSTRHATYLGHPRTTMSFKFGYVVQAGDVDTDGLSIPANALELNGGSFTLPGTTTPAVLTLDSLPTSAAHKVDGSRAGPASVARVSIHPPPSRDSTYTRSETFDVTAVFDRGVAVDTTGGRPRIALQIGDSTRYAIYSHAHNFGPANHVFNFEVQAGDVDTDGLSIPANALELNGGTITAPDDTVRADVSHDAVTLGSAYKVNGDRSDAPHARWTWFHAPASGDTFLRDDQVVLTVTFDRPTAVDTVGGRPRVALQVGDSTRHATYLGHPRTTMRFEFGYVVQAGDVDTDGLSIPANALELNGGSFTLPGTTTPAVLTLDSLPTSAAHKVDGSRAGPASVARVSIHPPPSRDSTYTRSETFDVTAVFDRGVAVDTTGGRPRIALQIGDSTRYAIYSHAHNFGPANHVFNFEVQAGDVDTDGLSIPANALELNGGTITAPDDTVRADVSHDAVTLGSAYKVNGDRSDAPHARWTWFHAPASGDTFLRDDQVVLTVTFDRPTAVDTVGGRPRVALQVGDSTRHATYLGHPRTTMRFEFGYVVQAGDVDTDGLSIPANALELNGGSFTLPGTTTPAVLTHDSLPTSAAHKVDGSRTAGDAVPEENRAPEVVSAIAPITMEVASPAVAVDLSAHFRDPDGDDLRYFADSATPRSVRADVAGGALTVAALAMGESMVTVRVADPDGAEAAQSFLVTVEASRADRARIMKRSLAAFGRAVGTETVEAIGGRLGAQDDGFGATGVGPGAVGEAHLQVGGRPLSCVGAGERCGLAELARQAAGVLGLRMSQGAGSLGSALWAAAKGSHDTGALRGLAGSFGRSGTIGSTVGVGSVGGYGSAARYGPGSLGFGTGYGAGGFGAQGAQATGLDAPGPHGRRAGWGRLISMDPVSRDELLTRSSFRFSPGTGGRGTPGADEQRMPDAGQQGMPDTGGQATPGGWTFWGQANAGGFKEGQPEDDLALDGTVRSAYLGADYRFGAGPLVGLALSRTTSSIGFESGINGTGTVDARLTSLYPYAQWSPRAGLSLWGLVGAGRGTAALLEDVTRREFATDIGMAMTAAGVRQRLTGLLAVKADAFVVRTDAEEVRDLAGVVATVHRLRVASEIGGRWGLSTGSTITSRVELGARFDGGDAETGAGAEAGAGIGYAHEGIGLTVDARGRALVAHQASSLRDWGASVAVRLRPSREAGGLSMTIEPTWGNAASDMAMLWRDGPAASATGAAGVPLGVPPTSQAGAAGPLPSRAATASRLRMEVDYAIVLADNGQLAPFGRWTAEGGAARRLNVGLRLSVLEAATLDLFGEQLSGGVQPTDRRLGLQGAVRFR